ncbi:MAG: hypothetical protein RR405_00130 [Clostridia bacterium]
MKITECERKNIKVTCTEGIIVTGFCIEYLSAADAEDDRACIYIRKGPHACIEIFEEEILKIEEIK